jgi:hypothetical protein
MRRRADANRPPRALPALTASRRNFLQSSPLKKTGRKLKEVVKVDDENNYNHSPPNAPSRDGGGEGPQIRSQMSTFLSDDAGNVRHAAHLRSALAGAPREEAGDGRRIYGVGCTALWRTVPGERSSSGNGGGCARR